MAGIRAFGGYVPRYRLGKETAGWGHPVEKAVANFDEDSITMAVAAGMDCLRGIDRRQVQGLYFATTTPPYAEKQNAAIIAEALDLGSNVFTTDITGVMRAGTIALRTALDAVRAGTADNILVVAADTRMAAPRSDLERNIGDGAAAFLLSREGVAAEVTGSFFLTDNMLEVWRTREDAFVRSWEDRFIQEEGYQRLVPQAVKAFLEQQGARPDRFARVVLYAPDGRQHAAMVRRLGFSPEQVQDSLFGRLGNTGAAFVPMLLAAALKEARPGEEVLTINYGDGADVFSFRVTEAIEEARQRCRGVMAYLESKQVLPNYETYARWREVWTAEGARRPPPQVPSVSALWRERDQNIRLYGCRCTACGTVQYPPQQVCVNCGQRGETEPVRLSDKGGTVFTYSFDYLAGTPDVPLVLAVVNFDGGGRMLTMMTDRELGEIRVGMPVEMSFRKLRTVGGIHNYYWKSVPLRIAPVASQAAA